MESTATVQIAVTARLRTSLRLTTTPDELLGLLGIMVLLLLLLSQQPLPVTFGTPTQACYLGFLRALGSLHPLNISFWCATLEATTAGFSCQVLWLRVGNHVTTLLWIHPASIFEPRTQLPKG